MKEEADIDEYTTLNKTVEPGVMTEVQMGLVAKCLKEFLQARQEADKLASTGSVFKAVFEHPGEVLEQDPLMPPATPVVQTQTTTQKATPQPDDSEQQSTKCCDGRDPGVSDADWSNLQHWKKLPKKKPRSNRNLKTNWQRSGVDSNAYLKKSVSEKQKKPESDSRNLSDRQRLLDRKQQKDSDSFNS